MPIQIINKKIPFHGKAIRKFAKWLNKEYKVQPIIRLEIYPTPVLETEVLDLYKVPFDEIQNNFGMYDNITGTILLAVGAVDETLALLHLAHEYRHALQHLNDRRFGEQEADHWAANVLLAYHTDKRFEWGGISATGFQSPVVYEKPKQRKTKAFPPRA